METSVATPAVAAKAPDPQELLFSPVPCLLTVDDLTGKIDEQIRIAWNGPNA